MKACLHSPRTWSWIFGGLIIASLLWAVALRVGDVAAIQNAVQRDWEISFGWGPNTTQDLPAGLPAFIDTAVGRWFERKYAHTHGYDYKQPAKTRNRGPVYHERFRAVFRGPIREIHVYYPEKFQGDLGAALARFPSLRRVSVFENEEDGPSEADWALLCDRLRSFPDLEEIELGGAWLTDATIKPLAGHSRLRVVTILEGRLTADCTKTFASMPHLTKLHIEGQRYDGEAWLSPESQKVMSAALPRVALELP